MRAALALTAIGHLALLGGCGRTPDDEPEQRVEETRQIAVPPDSTVTSWGSNMGVIGIVVTIPEGHPGAGTYTSNSSHLVEAAQDVMKTLGDPGVEVSIEVDDSGQIHSITHSVTKK